MLPYTLVRSLTLVLRHEYLPCLPPWICAIAKGLYQNAVWYPVFIQGPCVLSSQWSLLKLLGEVQYSVFILVLCAESYIVILFSWKWDPHLWSILWCFSEKEIYMAWTLCEGRPGISKIVSACKDLGWIPWGTRTHLKMSCQYHHCDLYCDITLCLD